MAHRAPNWSSIRHRTNRGAWTVREAKNMARIPPTTCHGKNNSPRTSLGRPWGAPVQTKSPPKGTKAKQFGESLPLLRVTGRTVNRGGSARSTPAKHSESLRVLHLRRADLDPVHGARDASAAVRTQTATLEDILGRNKTHRLGNHRTGNTFLTPC